MAGALPAAALCHPAGAGAAGLSKPGDWMGSCRVVRLLGEDGMGTCRGFRLRNTATGTLRAPGCGLQLFLRVVAGMQHAHLMIPIGVTPLWREFAARVLNGWGSFA